MKTDKNSRPTSRLAEWVDIIVKLSASVAVLLAAFVANEYQSSMTTVSLLSKREEAESSMRAKMFSDLIGPITGPNKEFIPVAREQLMVELLALNFHEHFELKPLLLRVDERLATEKTFNGSERMNNGSQIEEVTDEDRRKARGKLKSIARRVVQRQIALLTKEDAELDSGEQSCIYQLVLNARNPLLQPDQTHRCLQTIETRFNELITVGSPNHTYKLMFYVASPSLEDWEKEEFNVIVKLRHICAYTAEMIGVGDLNNAHSEIAFINELKNGKFKGFVTEDEFQEKMKLASAFKSNAGSEMYDVKVLQLQAAHRWMRVKKYQKVLYDSYRDEEYFPDLSLAEIENLQDPRNMPKLPADVSCNTNDNSEGLLNSVYSLDIKNVFTLTPFDFPFTDNTLLADGTRFSIVLDNIRLDSKDSMNNSATFKVIWFPKNYIAARERPINYSDIRSKLGINMSN